MRYTRLTPLGRVCFLILLIAAAVFLAWLVQWEPEHVRAYYMHRRGL